MMNLKQREIDVFSSNNSLDFGSISNRTSAADKVTFTIYFAFSFHGNDQKKIFMNKNASTM